MKYRIMEPRFDGLYSTMPNLGLTEAQAEAVTRFLLVDAEPKGLRQSIQDLLPEKLAYRHLAYALGAGALIGLPIGFALSWIGRLARFRRR